MNSFTPSDLKLLSELQADASTSHADLADRLAMSRSTCWRRIQELEQAGIIRKRVALLDAAKLGLRLLALVSVSMLEHTDTTRAAFEDYIHGLPEILEAYSTSGNWDYLLIVLMPDMEAFEAFLNHKILHHPSVRSSSSSFALRRVKYSTELPL
jgi:DNA-binding Lrp family transcriptional regulator